MGSASSAVIYGEVLRVTPKTRDTAETRALLRSPRADLISAAAPASGSWCGRRHSVAAQSAGVSVSEDGGRSLQQRLQMSTWGLLGFAYSPPPVVSFPRGSLLVLSCSWLGYGMTQAKYVLYFSVLPSLVFESTGSLLVLCSPEVSLFTSVCSYLYTAPVVCVCETGRSVSGPPCLPSCWWHSHRL